MFEQYLRIKEGYPDALLFYRMGDFYELFFEDAEVASRELQIALTSRNPNAEAPIPMCGVPWHAAEGYVSQLLNKGYKIAFCDQVEDPRAAKGLVERAVTRVYTPGTAVEDVSLEPKGHTYLGALFWSADTDRGGFAWVDVSTGYWAGLHVKKSQELWQWAQKIAPRELLLPEDADVPASLHLTDIQAVRVPLRSHFDYKRSAERVLAAQSVAELGALGLEGRKELVQACGALLAYLEQTQMQDTKHLAPFEPLDLGQHLLIDDVTERNLELFRRLDGRKGVGTLRHVIDSTQTPMGGRLLEERLRNPWRELAPIQETQDAIAWLIAHPENRKKLRETLSGVYDLERLSTRIAQIGSGVDNLVGIGTPRLATTVVLTLLVGLVVIGGMKSLLSVTEKLVPFMSVMYMAGCLVVIAMNVGNLPGALAAVFADDFTGHAAVGGFVGATVTQSIRWGIARGCYSNDAGTGVTTIVHAVADVNHPIQQSMWAVFEVFFDTIIVCSMTCLVVLTSGVWTLKLDPAIMTATAFEQSLGSFGGLLVTIAVVLFTFTTACAQIEFTEAQFIALVGEKARGVARWIMLVLILGGGMVGISKLITYVDFFAGVYVLVNMLGVYWCNGQIVELFKEYFSNPQRWETEKWAPWVKMEKEYAARKGLNK